MTEASPHASHREAVRMRLLIFFFVKTQQNRRPSYIVSEVSPGRIVFKSEKRYRKQVKETIKLTDKKNFRKKSEKEKKKERPKKEEKSD